MSSTPIEPSPLPVPDLFPDQPRWQYHDTILLSALMLFAAAWIALKVHWTWTPMEDAAMLLRYSQNFATGHGIRWSLNQKPVDGATDFLFMILTGVFARRPAHQRHHRQHAGVNIIAADAQRRSRLHRRPPPRRHAARRRSPSLHRPPRSISSQAPSSVSPTPASALHSSPSSS